MSSYAQNGIAKFRDRMNAKKQDPSPQVMAPKPLVAKSKSPVISQKPVKLPGGIPKKKIAYGKTDFSSKPSTSAATLPVATAPITTSSVPANHGKTAEFLMQETYSMIQAKLESAERKVVNGFGKTTDVQPFKEVQHDTIPEEDEFKKPVSGRSSRQRFNKI